MRYNKYDFNSSVVANHKMFKKLLLTPLLFCYWFYKANATIDSTYNSLQKDTISNFSKEKYISLLLVTPELSIYFKGFGVKYSGLFPLKKFPRTAIGFSFFIERIEPNKNFKLAGNITEVKVGYNTPGISLIHRFNKYFCIQGGLSILTGKEEIKRYYYEATSPNPWNPTYVIKYKREANNITGFDFEQNIYYLPLKKDGFVLGVGVFERGIDSSIYDFDLGGKFSFGIHF